MGKRKPLHDYLNESEYMQNHAAISPLFETHFHLDMIKETPEEQVVEGFKKLGIDKAITISTSKKNWTHVKNLSHKYEQLFYTLGTHPHEADSFNKLESKKIIESNLEDSKMVAVGEIGLDYFYNFSKVENQKSCFSFHLDLAWSLKKPVVIHNRESDKDMISIIKEKNSPVKNKGVIHSFSSSLELAEFGLSQGFFLGFNGMSTFKNAENVREAIRLCPLDKILLETDSPFLTPAPYRGNENSPSYLPLIAIKIAEIKKIDLKQCIEQTYKNSLQCFQINKQKNHEQN